MPAGAGRSVRAWESLAVWVLPVALLAFTVFRIAAFVGYL